MKHPAVILLSSLLLMSAAAGAAPPSGSAPPLVFIIPPVENVDVMYERFLPVKDHLERASGRTVALRVAQTYQEVIENIGSGQAELAYLDPAAYCEARSRAAIVPLVRTVLDGEAAARSVIVTRADSPVSRIIDGRMKRLALGAPRSSSSSLIPAGMFKEVGVDLRDFRAVDYLEQEDRIALSVLSRRHDLGGMSEGVARKYLGDGLRIIRTSEPVPQYVVCASPRLP